MTQNARILRHLKDYGSITSLEAAQEYGILRLSARIYDLRRQGHDIRAIRETSLNRYGETACYFRYLLDAK